MSRLRPFLISLVILSWGFGASASEEWKVIHRKFSGDGWAQDWYLVPAIHLLEIKKTPGQPIPGGFAEDTAPGRLVFGPGRYRHRSLHEREHPLGHIARGRATRESPPRQASYSLGSIEKDWDFLIEYRDRVLRENGLTLDSPAVDRVRAVAKDIWMEHRDKDHIVDPKNNSPSSYPADCLLQSSFCVGAGNALVMVCHTMGIPARSVHMFDHTMSEVQLHGRWWFVENTPRNSREGNYMVDANFMEVWTNPTDPRFGFSPHQARFYWEMMDYFLMFGQIDGLQMHTGGYRRMYLTPQTAGLMYPGQKNIWYKSNLPDRYPLLWGKSVAQRFQQMKVRQGQAMRRTFWIGSLTDTKGIVAQFNASAAPADGSAPDADIPADGGEWFVSINGKRHYLRDLGGWRLRDTEGDNRPRKHYAFDVPLGDLKEQAVNEIVFGNSGEGREFFWMGAVLNVTEPPEACLRENVTRR
jgi:hypothetical protein